MGLGLPLLQFVSLASFRARSELGEGFTAPFYAPRLLVKHKAMGVHDGARIRLEAAMEIDGADAWREIRQWVLRKGPCAVIRRLAAGDVFDLENVAIDYCDETARAIRILDVAGHELTADEVASERAADFLIDGVMPASRRLAPEVSAQANSVAMDFLDWWAQQEDNPGALMAGRIAEAFGREVDRHEFDSGVPGSGQVIYVYRLAGRCWLTGEYGVFGVASTPDQALSDWEDGV